MVSRPFQRTGHDAGTLVVEADFITAGRRREDLARHAFARVDADSAVAGS